MQVRDIKRTDRDSPKKAISALWRRIPKSKAHAINAYAFVFRISLPDLMSPFRWRDFSIATHAFAKLPSPLLQFTHDNLHACPAFDRRAGFGFLANDDIGFVSRAKLVADMICAQAEGGQQTPRVV